MKKVRLNSYMENINGFNAADVTKVKKVYRETWKRTPSGEHLYYYVWSDKLQGCKWEKAANFTEVTE